MHTRRSGRSSARIWVLLAGRRSRLPPGPGTGTRGHGTSRGGRARQPADGLRRCAPDGADQRGRVVADRRRKHRVRRRPVHERATGRLCAGRQHREPQQPARVRHPDRRAHQLLGAHGQRRCRRRCRVSRRLSDLRRGSVHQRQRTDEEPDCGSQPHNRRRHRRPSRRARMHASAPSRPRRPPSTSGGCSPTSTAPRGAASLPCEPRTARSCPGRPSLPAAVSAVAGHLT